MTSVMGRDAMDFTRQWVQRVLAPVPQVRVTCLQQGWGELQFGRSIAKESLCLQGHTYTYGLGAHANSEILIETTAPVVRFRAVVGVDENTDSRNNSARFRPEIIFSIEVDGEQRWASPELRFGDAPVEVDVPLAGATAFTLKAITSGLTHVAHPDWAAARIEFADGSEVQLGESCLPTGMPFSFTYGEQTSAQLLPQWAMTQTSCQLDADVTVHQVVFHDPETGLECRFDLKEYADFPAVQWVVHFKNTGMKDTPVLSDAQAMDLSWMAAAESILHHAYGSLCAMNDFLPVDDKLQPGQSVRCVGGEGRSSFKWLPYFNLETGARGVISAIGWTGQWAAEFSRSSEGEDKVRMRAGMEHTHLVLHPGEEIRTPSILLMFWDGESITGHNLLRRFILKHNSPMPGGKLIQAPLCAGAWGGMKSHQHLDRIQVLKDHQLDYDYYWIDAGWYGPADSYSPDEHTGDWAQHVGNWTVNPAAHPDGLRPLSDAAHDAGMDFLLWFEPERAICGTPLTQEHPEWFLGEATPGANLILNLGIPEARAWLTDYISQRITEFGLDCYRQDFNIDPLTYWRGQDAPDRQGMTEIRYIEGLYAFWDELLRRHPQLVIDNCASGGRRLDIEMAARSIPLWRSDVQCWPNFDSTAGQVQTMGLSYWLPLSATGTQMHPLDTYNFRSALSAGLVFHLFMYERTPIDPAYPWDWHARMIADYKRARPAFYGDYYPLTPCTLSREVWQVYQMHRPDLGEGILVAFRREDSPFISADFRLRGLEKEADYLCEDADSGEVQRLTGRALMESGVHLVMAPHESRLIFYRRVEG